MSDERKNLYYCETCKGYICTIDRDKGVTPMFLACRVRGEPRDPTNTCAGQMRSMMYPKPPWPATDDFGTAIPTKPTWEWYNPTYREQERMTIGEYDYVRKGGLILRQIEAAVA
jgi:hypothetical protein